MEEIIKLHQFPLILNIPSVLIIIFISFILVWIITKLLFWYGNKNLPPSPPRIPILGNLHQIGAVFHRDLHLLAKKYGPDLMLLHFGNSPTLIVSSAAAAREIMKTHDLTFVNRFHYGVQKKLFYDGKDISFAPYGEVWRQLKSILVLHLLSKKMVQSFQAIREDETALLVQKIKADSSSSSSSPVNLSRMFSELTNNGICRSAFGRKYTDSEKGRNYKQLLTEFIELLGVISIGDVLPWLGWIKRVNGLHKRIDRVAKELDNFLEDLIRERTETASSVGGGGGGSSFVDMILEIHNDKSSGLSVDRDSIKAAILDVYAGGTDTTYSALEWAMTELLRHPRVMEKLQEEVREIVGDREEIAGEDLEKMQYLKAVIKETFRYRPPSPILVPRVAGADVKIMGYDVPAGTVVMVNVYAVGRDPASWEEPDKFEPGRFLNSSIDFKGLDYKLIPFGAGRRSCPGIAFSTATIEFVLANLVQKFDWELADGEDLDMTERPGVSSHRLLPLLAIATQTM